MLKTIQKIFMHITNFHIICVMNMKKIFFFLPKNYKNTSCFAPRLQRLQKRALPFHLRSQYVTEFVKPILNIYSIFWNKIWRFLSHMFCNEKLKIDFSSFLEERDPGTGFFCQNGANKKVIRNGPVFGRGCIQTYIHRVALVQRYNFLF